MLLVLDPGIEAIACAKMLSGHDCEDSLTCVAERTVSDSMRIHLLRLEAGSFVVVGEESGYLADV